MISFFVISLFLQCTWIKDANNNVLLGPGCTAADIFVDAAHNDFRLRSPASTNPAVGNALCLPAVPDDIMGNPRPGAGQTCDIGAYEYQPPTAPPAAPTHLRLIL